MHAYGSVEASVYYENKRVKNVRLDDLERFSGGCISCNRLVLISKL